MIGVRTNLLLQYAVDSMISHYWLHYRYVNLRKLALLKKAACLSWSSNLLNSSSEYAAYSPAASFSYDIKIWQNNLPGIVSCKGLTHSIIPEKSGIMHMNHSQYIKASLTHR